jgi:hypothetical protein
VVVIPVIVVAHTPQFVDLVFCVVKLTLQVGYLSLCIIGPLLSIIVHAL